MKLKIKEGKFTLTGHLQDPPPRSRSGKSKIYATTRGAENLEGFKVNLNIYKQTRKNN